MKTIALMLAMALPAAAQSLWEQGGGNTGTAGGGGGGSPYDPPKRPPYKKHDLIQVVVLERSKATSTADLRTDRRSRWETEFDEFIRFDTKSGRRGKDLPRLRAADLTDDPAIDIDARYRQDNTGRTTRNFDLSFTITAEVVDVRPNGNLVIQAKKKRKVNDDTESITLTGEISPSMVVNNTIKSDGIANLDISYTGKGSVSDPSNKPGLLGWLINQIWPF